MRVDTWSVTPGKNTDSGRSKIWRRGRYLGLSAGSSRRLVKITWGGAPWVREHGVGSSPSRSVQSWSGTLRLTFLWFCAESDARPILRDERGTPDNCASMSSGSWNGVLPQGNIQTSRRLGKMCTEKRGLCRKISRCLWIKMVYLLFP